MVRINQTKARKAMAGFNSHISVSSGTPQYRYIHWPAQKAHSPLMSLQLSLEALEPYFLIHLGLRD